MVAALNPALAADPQRLAGAGLAERIRLAYRQLPLNVLGSNAAAYLLVIILWDKVAAPAALIWLALVFATTGLGFMALHCRYWRSAPGVQQAPLWARRFTWSAALGGCAWGCSAFALFVPADLQAQLVVYAFYAGMVAAVAVTMAAHQPAYYAFQLPMVVPVITRLAAEGGTVHIALALTAVIYVGIMTYYVRNIHATLRDAIQLRFLNAALVDELTAKKEEAEQANEDKSRFLAAASHDLRQPLHAQSLFIGELRQRLRGHACGELVEKLAASSHVLQDLLDALLDISKLDAGVVRPAPKSFELQQLLDELAQEFAPVAAEQDCRLRVRPARYSVQSDYTLLGRILRNYIANALRYTRAGGVLVGARRRGGLVRIEVWDTGIGIADDHQQIIFKEFLQLHNPARERNKGMGLGLSVVDRLARLLGHPIGVSSRPGRGSVFLVSVPLAVPAPQAAVVAPDAGAYRAALDLQGVCVLLVDDETSILDATTGLLRSWGCTVIAVDSAAAALARLRDGGRRPDVVLCDYRLQDGPTGLAAIEAVRRACGSDVPAILITGDTAPERIREVQASAYPLLHKPVQAAKLRTLLAYVLTGGGA